MMTRPSCGCLLVAGALIALPATAVGPQGSAAAREAKSLFSQFRMPWSQPAKPARRARRPAKPVGRTPLPVVAAPVPIPRPAPEPKKSAAPGVAATPPAEAPQQKTPDAAPATPDTPVATAPEPPSQSDDDAARAERAAGFAAIRAAPTPPPPLAPLPSLPKDAPPSGKIARGVPLPPSRAPSVPDAPPGPQVAMIPRAPLGGPHLPGPPDANTPPPVTAPEPSARAHDPDCEKLAEDGFAVAKPLPPILGPYSCGAPLPVELSGVRLKDGSIVAVKPAAILRCETARAVAAYVRDDLAPAAEKAGPALTELRTAASYICRGRNNRANAKMSEHGLANALDIAGFGFKDGSAFDVYDKKLSQDFLTKVKIAACAQFNTVLGPGSDGFHEDHLHVDLRKRKNARSKLCQWKGS